MELGGMEPLVSRWHAQPYIVHIASSGLNIDMRIP